MGVRNVGLVYARWVHLPDRSFRALTYMALRSLDDDDPPMFWGGREELAFALGKIVPPEPADSDLSARAEQYRKQRASDFQAVKMAVMKLTSVNVVTLERKSRGGLPAMYALHLALGLGYDGPTPPSTTDVPLQYAEPTPSGTSGVPLAGGVGGVTFGTKEEQTEGDKEINSSKVSKSPANPSEIALTPEIARGILGRLPDLGQEYLTRLAGIDGMHNRYVAAASLVVAEHPHLMPRETA
jgi:hypothetical protein